MYLRQVTVMLGLIILCMVLLGAGFFSLSYRHQLEEIQTTLDRNAGFISSYANAAITKGDSLSGEDFINYIYSAVRLTDTTVLVCNTKGQILCAAGVNLNEDLLNSSTIADLSVPSWAVNQLLNGKPYSGVTTFGQLLSSKCYLTSEVLSPLVQDRVSGELISSGIPTGFLFVAADATSVLDFLENTFQLFFITAVAVLLISLVICSITVQRMVDPLKGMCAFAHKFAHGEVDTRITEYTNRKDEIGELAIGLQRHGRLPGPGRAKAQRVCGQRLPRAENSHDHHRRLCRRHSGRYHPPGKGAGILTGYLFRNPPPVPAGPPDAGALPAPVLRTGGRPGAV